MNSTAPMNSQGNTAGLLGRLASSRKIFRPAPVMDLVEWADTYRQVASETSASPGQWKTTSQPVAFGPMRAVTDADTHTVTVMAGTQILKTELCLCAAFYFIHLDPSPILLVQPTQGAAEAFSKERFAPSVEATPVLRGLIASSKSRDSDNTITGKSFPAGRIDFVGANSPTDLSSRPKRIVIEDEIDKYPTSAGAEGDPVRLAEERASTYHAVGRAKFIRTCSPTEEGTSRIAREYEASDRRKCFVACPHCGFEQTLAWADVHWDKDASGANLPETAGILCQGPDCGAIWSESDRRRALNALEFSAGNGWRQTREFSCCDETQQPTVWDDCGRSLCKTCGSRAPYAGHAGFNVSKFYSKRHRLADIVKEFLEAKGEPELLRKWTNTALAEVWTLQGGEKIDSTGLMSRQEAYGPDDLPNRVMVVTGFADVQGNRIEAQMIGWGSDEEAWPFLYEVINLDPAQPQAWKELDALLLRIFKRKDGRKLRVAAFGIDTGGNHGAMVYDFCRHKRGRRIFACKGTGGKRPLWPTHSSRSKLNDPVWVTGVDTGKDALYSRLRFEPPVENLPRSGYIHFPSGPGFGPDYFEQLTSERRVTRKKMGQPYTIWELPSGKKNEVLDTFVGAMAVRRSLPHRIEAGLEYDVTPDAAMIPPPPARRSLASMVAR